LNQVALLPGGLSKAEVTVKLNTDFGMAGMSSQDLQAVVAAWQSGAISRDTMFELFRSGEILPDGRTNEDEKTLISTGGNGGENIEHPTLNIELRIPGFQRPIDIHWRNLLSLHLKRAEN